MGQIAQSERASDYEMQLEGRGFESLSAPKQTIMIGIPPFRQVLLQIGDYYIARILNAGNGDCWHWAIGRQGNPKKNRLNKTIKEFWYRKLN